MASDMSSGEQRRTPSKRPARTRILVVEDDDDVRAALRETLESEGYDVVTAGNGIEALQRLHDGALPKLIVLDLMMPLMNGWQFRTAQRSDPAIAAIPVVVLSAVGGSYVESVQPLDAAAFVRKPFEFDVLLETVARYVS